MLHPDTRAFCTPWFSGPDSCPHIWVNSSQGVIHGFYSARFKRRDDHVSLYFVAVDEPYRGKGIGSYLIRHLKQRLFASGRHDCILLKCKSSNEGAMRFWLRHDFQAQVTDGTNVLMKFTKVERRSHRR